MGDEFLEGGCLVGQSAAGIFCGERQGHHMTGLEEIDQYQTQTKRQNRGELEIQDGLDTDTAHRVEITHLGSAKDQRRNDHLDQTQKGKGHQAKIFDNFGNDFWRGGGVDDGTDDNADDQSNANVECQALSHEQMLPADEYDCLWTRLTAGRQGKAANPEQQLVETQSLIRNFDAHGQRCYGITIGLNGPRFLR